MFGISTLAPTLVLPIAIAVAIGDATKAADTDEIAPMASPIVDPSFQLIHDSAVRRELKLTRAQQMQLDEILRKNIRLLLSVRDVSPGGAAPALKPSFDQLRQEALGALNADQQSRFEQLVLQAQGFDALRRDDVAISLQLTPAQRRKLLDYNAELRAEVRQLQQPEAGNSPEQTQQLLVAAQERHRQRVLAELTDKQQQEIAARMGEKFDLSQVRASAAWAPELESIAAWLNSPPLKLESLRGKVVVVHFFAFGCINCIHNYPWYREWQNELPKDEVVMLGIHTPETTAEADIEQLRASLAKNELTFPVAVDNDKKNWQNWSNDIWPAVYLIDREGRVRYWWYGELDWQGAGGQDIMRRRIDELVAEAAPTN